MRALQPEAEPVTANGTPDPDDARNEQQTVLDCEHVAWHEAGHGVVAAALGQRHIEVSLQGTGELDGYSFKGWINYWATGGSPYASIPVLFAGFLAERKVNPDRGLCLRAAARDFEFIDRLDPHRFPDGVDAQWRRETFPTPSAWRRFVRGQLRVAARLLKRHEYAHRRLVRLLLDYSELDPTDFQSFAEEAGLSKKRPVGDAAQTTASAR